MSAPRPSGGLRSGQPSPGGVSAFWDAEATRYDNAYDASGSAGRALRSRHQAVLRLLGDGPGEVLDIGMGPGRLLFDLSQRGWQVSGVDTSEQMVVLAASRIPDARTRLIRASAERLPFPDSSFDAVVATGLLGYVGYENRVLSELARVLRPGGVAVLSIANALSFSRLWRRGVVYPLARAVKRIVPFGRPAPLRRPQIPSARWFEMALTEAGLTMEARRYTSFSVPGGALFPVRASRLAERLEGRNSRVSLPLAGQIVYAARKGSALTTVPAERGVATSPRVKPKPSPPMESCAIRGPRSPSMPYRSTHGFEIYLRSTCTASMPRA